MMDGNGDKPDRKHTRRDMKMASKSSSLPPGAMLMPHSGEGFFMKIRRCLKLRSKGKYELGHSHPASEPNGRTVSTSRHGSTGASTSREDDVANSTDSNSSPHKAYRKSQADKEEVVLIRKDKRNSSGIKLTGKDTEGKSSDVLVVTIGDHRLHNTEEAAGGASAANSTELSKDVFENLELDPDYETLDDIRRKVRSEADSGNVSATTTSIPVSSKPLQHAKIKTSSDLNGQDSGLGSPFTDSLCSSRDSQGHSVTSSVFGSSVASDSLTESTQSVSSVVHVDGLPPPAADGGPMVISTTSSLLCSSSVLEEDDLYSNADVLLRKKSQKQSQSHTSLSLSEQHSISNELFVEEQKSVRSSLTPADFFAMMEEENSAPLVPPPLPARNYSEEDISTQSEKETFSNHCSVGDVSAEPRNRTSSDDVCIGTGARPKTYTSSRHSASVEQGPVLTIVSSDPDNTSNNVGDEHFLSTDNSGSHSPYSSSNNIYEDIPARQESKQLKAQICLEHSKKEEEDLIYIDDDQSGDCVIQTDRADSVELPENVMIVSASDSLCGTDNDSSKGTSLSQLSETDKHSANSLSSSSDPEQAAVCASVSDEEKMDLKVSYSKHNSLKHPACSTAASKEESSTCAGLPNVPSSPSQDNSISPPSTFSSSSASSSDTLNNLMDDPDDFEGRDLSPPVGPPIHISHQQLMRHLDARMRGEAEPSTAAHQPDSRNGAARNARSMEIPSSHFMEHEGNQASAANVSRRHSSSVAATSSHQDFLESMKQLKDCGWYWGPLSYEEAESKLSDKMDGSFLVRDSSNENYILSLSFKSMGQVHHTRIEHHKGLFSFWSQPDSHGKAQICQFIEQTMENSKNGRFLYFLRPAGPGSPPLPIQLLYPVSRFFRVPSLQHMCRFLVLRRVRRDHIDFLPLPQKVKRYLLENQYYVESLEED